MQEEVSKEPMTKTERANYCLKNAKHKLSLPCIRSRIERGWSDEKIINTPVGIVAHRPKMSHPFKRKAYNRVALRKGWVDSTKQVTE